MENNEFGIRENRTGIIRWMWWLYIVVGAFIIALLLWMFVAISSDSRKQQELEQAEMQLTPQQIENAGPGLQIPQGQ